VSIKLAIRAALACYALSAASHPAAAFSALSDPDIGALREYAQRVDADTSTSMQREIATDGLSALRGYAQQIGARHATLRESVDAGRGNDLRVAANAPPKTPKTAAPRAGVNNAAGAAQDATYVGSQVCATCHAAQAAKFNQTLMGKIFRNPRDQREKSGCETCHGPGSLHVGAGGGRGVGGILSFRLDDSSHTADDFNDVCLACHEKGNRTLWRGSEHETRGLACTNCHIVMRNVTPKNQLAQLTEMDTCFQCHKDKRSEVWQSSHMPVREGKMTCSSCHNPHGSYGEALLKTATINDVCYKCHAEKRGPFLWEHAPVRESCINCHDPHGTMNDSLLKVSRPRLCQQCHTAADHPGNPGNTLAIYSIGSSCSNCHVKIHGSNSPAGSQLVR
jgi:DmsE family decaheme c-type cytochrome